MAFTKQKCYILDIVTAIELYAYITLHQTYGGFLNSTYRLWAHSTRCTVGPYRTHDSNGNTSYALPHDAVMRLLKKYGAVK